MVILNAGRAATCLLALLALATTAQAQVNARRTSGMWFAAGAGAGSAKVTCDGCDEGANSAPTGTVGVGYTMSPRLQVAAEVTGWVRPLSGDRTVMGHAGVMLYAYPLPAPFVIGAGIGFSRYVDRNSRDGVSQRNRFQGLGARASLGYDLPLASGFTATPTIGMHRSLGGKVSFNGEESDLDAKSMVIDAAIVVRWHWGTPIRSR